VILLYAETVSELDIQNITVFALLVASNVEEITPLINVSWINQLLAYVLIAKVLIQPLIVVAKYLKSTENLSILRWKKFVLEEWLKLSHHLPHHWNSLKGRDFWSYRPLRTSHLPTTGYLTRLLQIDQFLEYFHQ